jgi:hypothetical protein
MRGSTTTRARCSTQGAIMDVEGSNAYSGEFENVTKQGCPMYPYRCKYKQWRM